MEIGERASEKLESGVHGGSGLNTGLRGKSVCTTLHLQLTRAGPLVSWQDGLSAALVKICLHHIASPADKSGCSCQLEGGHAAAHTDD
mmetsp:Transcript_37388/g.149213  ORF Transcript_37388/g.149213 Transcript_37388/m.149213 type:complete len:88 (-) Transcript_37388:106-369(-)